MSGSTIFYSNLKNAGRFDAEYFQPGHFGLYQKFKTGEYGKLSELCEFIHTGPAGALLTAANYVSKGIKVCRPTNLNGWTCVNDNIVFISEKYRLLRKIKIYQESDILISRVGNIKFAIIGESEKCVISPNLICLRTKKKLLNPYFLLAYLNSKAGYNQILRGQKNVSLKSITSSDISNILIPRLTLKNQTKIASLIRTSLKKRRQAEINYHTAENNLLKKITSKSKHTHHFPISTTLSRLCKSSRADAEYFIYKKSEKSDQIKTVLLKEIAVVLSGKEVGSDSYQKSGKLFLRTSNISKFGLLNKSQKFINGSLYKKLSKKFQPQIGEILLVKDGTPGIACLVSKPIAGIISGGIVRLQLQTTISPEYICLCLNSPICRQFIKADLDGSLVPHWKIRQIKNLPIPVLDVFFQKKTTNILKKSSLLIQEAEKYLSVAKNYTPV